MLSIRFTSIFIKHTLINQKNVFRNVRSIARRGDGPKIIEGIVKTVTQNDDFERIESYKDLVQSVQKSKLGDELEIERNFLREDYHGDVFEKCDKYYDMHLREEKGMRSFIKRKIVARKYFKSDRETNLLTHAAKQQIKFLHNSNPLEWNYKILSECFPISEAGVKKLLKCNFVLNSPEKIKAHDEAVARRWKILKSGQSSDEIFPLTQKLYKEGKLIDDYFSGNPNLPTAPPPNREVIELKRTEPIGEFSAIVKTYHDYEKKKLLESKESAEKQVSIRNNDLSENFKKQNAIVKNALKFKIASEENDDNNTNPEIYPNFKKKKADDYEVPFSQFKEIMKEENEIKLKSKYKTEYNDYVQQQISRTDDQNTTLNKPKQSGSCFLKISKYEKENVDAMFEKDKNLTKIYKYDEKMGYQYPAGERIKNRINVSSKQCKKGKLIKIGKCIYDEYGEFLCKVPT